MVCGVGYGYGYGFGYIVTCPIIEDDIICGAGVGCSLGYGFGLSYICIRPFTMIVLFGVPLTVWCCFFF